MTSAEIVKALREECKTCIEISPCMNGANLSGFYCATSDAANLIERMEKKIKRLEKGKAETQWIPATEPPKEWKDEKTGYLENYLVTCVDGAVDIGSYHALARQWICCDLPVTVTHWAPLPKAPEVRKDG